MGSRSRKARRRGADGGAVPPAPPDAAPSSDEALKRGYARGRERDERIRAGLAPLRDDERPPALLVAAALAAALGLVNLGLFLAGVEVQGERPNTITTLLFCALLLTAAVGMYRKAYWAVLGFQALLALITLVFALFLLRASNALAVVVCVAIIGVAGTLFFKLVRVLARIQLPERRRRDTT
jgi:hypothetical protein